MFLLQAIPATTDNRTNMTNTSNTAPTFTGYLRTSDGSTSRVDFCSIGAALQLGYVQPHEDPSCLYHHQQGKLSYAAAIESGLVDEEAAAAIKASDNVFRAPRGVIEAPKVAPVGPMGGFEGTPAGAVAAALRKYVASRSEEDLAGFARALAGALGAL